MGNIRSAIITMAELFSAASLKGIDFPADLWYNKMGFIFFIILAAHKGAINT
jgi:hypothetical protein